jgi:hypothetical protein
MFINFDEVSILKSIGIDYFSHSKQGLVNMRDSELSELHNQWLTYKEVEESLGHSNGADVRCQVVHIGKKLEGNKTRLRIAVYHEENRMDTLILFPITKIAEAIQCMYTEAGYGELTCVE